MQFAKNNRVYIFNKRDGTKIASANVLDGQPAIPRGWNKPKTQIGDYVLIRAESVKCTSKAKYCVCEQENWLHYLRKDWTAFDKEEDDDDDGDGWEMTMLDILDEGEDFLVYREFLTLPPPAKPKKARKEDAKKAKTNVSSESTDVLRARDRKKSHLPRKQPANRQ